MSEPVEQIRIYVDTNIVSRLADQRIKPGTAAAFSALARRTDVLLVTSDKTRDEVLQTKNKVRSGSLELLVALFEKVQYLQLHISGALGDHALGEVPLGDSYTEPVFAKLLGIFEWADAEHIALAAKSSCTYFLTLDEKTILSRASARKEALFSIVGGMRIVSPEELVAALEVDRQRGIS